MEKLKYILIIFLTSLIIFTVLYLFILGVYHIGFNDAKIIHCKDLFRLCPLDYCFTMNSISNSYKVHNLCFLILSMGVAFGLTIHGFPFTFKIQNNYDEGDYSIHDYP